MSQGELLALFPSERLMRQFRGTPFEPDLPQAIAKLGEMLPASAAHTLGPEPAVCAWHLAGIKRGVPQKVLVLWSSGRQSHCIHRVSKGWSRGPCWRNFGGKETG
jgi:hypothetical protein